MNTLPDKKAFRKLALQKRNSLSADQRASASKEIQKRLISLPAFEKAQVIMGYMDFKSEVICTDILRFALNQGKRVVIPISLPKTRTLLLSEITDLDRDFEKDYYGISVPKKEFFREISPEKPDFVIVPGVAFSKERFRMGYGAGYYDNFLERLRPDTPFAALAFEIQIFDTIPTEPHDKQMTFVVTEKRILGSPDNSNSPEIL